MNTKNTKSLVIGELMHTIVETISENATLLNAAKVMRDRNVSSLVVDMRDENDALGMLTRKDVVTALLDTAPPTPQLVKDVMTKPAITVNSNLSVENCLRMMMMTGIRRVPVVDGTTLMGIVSNSDVFAHLVKDIP